MKPRNCLQFADLLKVRNGGRVGLFFFFFLKRVTGEKPMSKKKLKTKTDKCLTGADWGMGSPLGEGRGDEKIVTPFDGITDRHGKW